MERFFWQDIISMNIYILRIVGLWPKNYEIYKLDWYFFYTTIFVVFFITPNVLFQTLNIIFVYSNLEALTETMLVCIAELLGLLKIYTFIKNIGMLKRLMMILESDIFQPKNARQKLLVEPAIKLWQMIYHTLIGTVVPALTLWLIFPILTGSVKKYGLPFSAWYPYDFKKSYFYELTYLHQVLGTSLVAFGDYNIDMLISALMMYVGAQCDLLCDNLRSLGVESNDFGHRLKMCIIHHKTILRFAENCNVFFNFIVLGQFFTSSACMAMALFRLALVTPSSFEFYTLLTSIISVVTQIFTYCWFGDEVQSKSEAIAYAAFESAWTEQCLSDKKNMMIFIRRTLAPIKLSTFKLFYLTLETFVKILRSAVSYYTLLRQFGGLK
ncbi:hypothetical protein Zmor_007665 [Zophobas morio]|uniref:Odorant receptor n=1 Tax=Zophobas morio TaxID=2755281 RepID=A0AA38IXR4_9CUCU|nr:hypothetical protein Zmor_007665 [Zophobas morio]